jgi:hypothetical protein
MACKDTKKFVTAEASTKAAMRTRGAIDKFLNITNLKEFRKLNTEWSNVAKERFGIQEKLFSEDDLRAVPNKVAFKAIDNAKGIYYQEGDSVASVASGATLEKVKQAATKMGINIQKMSEYLKNHPDIPSTGINALADIIGKVVAIAEGKEDVALTEEVVHVATAMLEQTHPQLITEMISKIGNYEIYKRTLEDYKDNPGYQLPNGKPDIRKIKKEAVDKLIAETIINISEGSTTYPELRSETNRAMVRNWWQRIIDVITGLYKKADINIFEQVASAILEGDIEGSSISEGVFYQLSDKQKAVQKRIIEEQSRLRKVVAEKASDPILMDTEEANNWYERQEANGTWTKVKRRVTDRVKAWYRKAFPSKTFTKEEIELNEFKRDHGIKGHLYFENIHKRFFNPDGTKKTSPDERPDIPDEADEQIYLKLEKYYTDLINKFSEKGEPMVFSEVMIYDPKEKEAGTIDLLIIETNGRANILDWKFMSVAKDAKDVQWYKQGAINVQLGRYKDILISQYGVKEMGMNRAIPILFDIKYKDYTKPSSKHQLKGIVIGSVDVTKIENLVLAPVSEQSESMKVLLGDNTEAYEPLDELLSKLNSIISQISKTTATTDEEREFKRERLNALRTAIRAVQSHANLTPLIDVIRLISKEGEMITNEWETKYKDKPSDYKGFTEEELSDFADDIRQYQDIADVFGEIDHLIGPFIYNENMEKEGMSEEELAVRKEIFLNIQKQVTTIKGSFKKISKVSDMFADKFIGIRNKVSGILRPTAVIQGLHATFRGVSELIPSMRVMYKLVVNAKGKASQDAIALTDKLLAIRTKLVERGGDIKELLKQIYQKDKEGRSANKLIYRYKKEFYDGVKDNSLEGARSKKWLNDNVDIAAYKKEANELLNKKIKKYNDLYDDNEELRDELILQEKRKWDIERSDFNGWDNYVLKRHPLQKWESDEYVALKKDGDLMDLYNLIHQINQEASEVGYISNKVTSTFLPFVRKSFAENLAWGNVMSGVANLGRELTLRAGDVGYGQVNELTGEYEYSIPRYYTYDFTQEGGLDDYKDVSEDLFKNMILYAGHLQKYKYLSAVEGQIQLIKNIETFKNHLATARNGDVINENGKAKELAGNEKNAAMFDVFMRALLYEQKYPLTSGDIPLGIGKALNYVKEGINKLAGRVVIPIDEEASATSLIKLIDATNRAFQVKTLGLEFISGAANAFGGNIQVATQAGNYFKASEFTKNEFTLLGNKFKSKEERDLFIALVDTFMPLKDDPTYERLKKAGMSTLTRGSMTDFLMFFMRAPEHLIEKSIFMSLLDNTMVENGKLVNIREYVKKKYPNRYSDTSRRRDVDKQIEIEIQELKKTRSITVTKKLEEGKLVIPGLDLSNREEIQRLTNLTRRIARNATGGMSDSDYNNANLNVWTKSMLVFKNWIPTLIQTRFGEFRKVSDDFSVEIGEDGLTTGEKYDIGRIRLFGYTLGISIRDLSLQTYNMLALNEKGMEAYDKMFDEYSRKYELSNGEPLNMTKEEFIDMVRTNLSNQMKELAMLLSLVSAAIAVGFIAPDDDDSRADKNFYRFSQKVFDKFIQELSFFYNPVEFQRLLSGSMFPAMGLASDIFRFSNHFWLQITGYDLSNPDLTEDEVREKAQPIKNAARMFPFTKSALTYGAIVSDDFAREFDITIQKESRR